MFLLSTLLLSTTPTDTNEDLNAISTALEQFAQGADRNDIKQQGEVMDESFRVVWNDTKEGSCAAEAPVDPL